MSQNLKAIAAALCLSLVASFTAAVPVQVAAATKAVSSVSSVAAKKKPAAKPAKTTTKKDCTIKGNISSTKEKIYHIPGCASYSATVIDIPKGEMIFCTEAEAKAAGWRKALNCPK
jgi:hypothetical protein